MASKKWIYVVRRNQQTKMVDLETWYYDGTVDESKISVPSDRFEDCCQRAVAYAETDATFAFLDKTPVPKGSRTVLELIWPAPPGSREGE